MKVAAKACPHSRAARSNAWRAWVRASPLLLAATAGSALAQTAAAPGASPAVPARVIDEGLRREAERERLQQEALTPRADNLRSSNRPTSLPDLPDERPCFTVSDISLVGADTQHFAWLQTATDPFVGWCVGVTGLSRIASYLDALLIEQGYVTSRVGIGQQNLALGRLEFRLQAGRIAEVRMLDKPLDARWGTWVNAFPTREGRLLSARDLEQGVEQMKRLPSQTVTATLTPGQAPDTSIVTLERQTGTLRDRIRGGITLDNSGSATLGRTQASANLALDNPLGVNDIANVSLNTNAEQPQTDHRSQSYALNYSVPLGYSTFSASTSHSRFAQNVQLTTTTTLSSGTSDTAELKWQHIAYRSSSAKTGVYAILSTRKASSFLDDVELVAQHRRKTFFETGITFKQVYANNASFEIEGGYRRGVPWLRAEDDLTADPLDPGAVPTLRPHLLTLSATLRLPFQQPPINGRPGRDFEYSASLHAQHTGEHTLSIDQIGIGGRNTVRGFDGDAVLLAESGWTLRNELTTPLKSSVIEGSLYVGVDAGHVFGASDINLVGRFLAGAAVGVRGRYNAAQFDLALAAPLIKPEGFKTPRASFYASATCAF